MPKAELTGVDHLIKIETCGHFMCSCKTTLDDSPTEALVEVKGSVIGDKTVTTMRIEDSEGNKATTQVNGIFRPEIVVNAFNEADGKMLITDAGLVCCALDRLGR
jgi:hypothetical protein